jgi:hypothetical protein
VSVCIVVRKKEIQLPLGSNHIDRKSTHIFNSNVNLITRAILGSLSFRGLETAFFFQKAFLVLGVGPRF